MGTVARTDEIGNESEGDQHEDEQRVMHVHERTTVAQEGRGLYFHRSTGIRVDDEDSAGLRALGRRSAQTMARQRCRLRAVIFWLPRLSIERGCEFC